MTAHSDLHSIGQQGQRPVPRRRLPRFGRIVLLGLLTAVVLVLLGALLVIGAQHMQSSPDTLKRWSTAAESIRLWGAVIQTALLLAVVLGWQRVVDWFMRKGWIGAGDRDRALKLRWRVLAFGAAYLLLVVIGPDAIWRAIAQ